jgi:hypothetical protein
VVLALLCAAQAESAQVFEAPEVVAQVESLAVAPDPSEALAAQELPAPIAVAESGRGVPKHSELLAAAQAEPDPTAALKAVARAAAAEPGRGVPEYLARAAGQAGPGLAAAARVAGYWRVARDR